MGLGYELGERSPYFTGIAELGGCGGGAVSRGTAHLMVRASMQNKAYL